jgi:hypothetical protein
MHELFEAKLQSSGLTIKDSEHLGIELLLQKDLKKMFPSTTAPAALWLKYFDLKKNIRPEVYRIRVLGENKTNQFGINEKKPKYLQPPNSVPAAYFPKTVDWSTIQTSVEQPLIITEGELKSACGCKHGLPTIGLGGVSSWQSAALQWDILPELKEFVWARRDVVVCFDSDYRENKLVCSEMFKLCEKLRSMGAMPAIANLPQEGDNKVGMDDYIVKYGIDAFKDIINEADTDKLALELHKMNSTYCYINNQNIIIKEKNNRHMRPCDARSTIMANHKVLKTVGDKKKAVVVVDEWLSWPHRRELEALTYRPGQPIATEGNYNLWQGWGCEEKQGDISPWKDLLDFLFNHVTTDERDWFERWLAYPIQHPGTKMCSAIGVWSVKQGVGKSLAGLLVGDCYGKNFSEISQVDFESPFTAWGNNKQFVLVDDISNITKTAQRDHASRVKTLISQEAFKVNIKYLPQYLIPDCVNYYMTSNQPDALLLDESDRRFFIHHAPESCKDKKWYDRIDEWRRSGEGPSALLYYLRRLDLKGFDKYTRPPANEAKREMTEHSRSDHDQWCVDLRDYPDTILYMDNCPLEGDLFTTSELLELYKRESGSNKYLYVNTLSVSLAKAGLQHRLVHLDHTTKKLIAVRNTDKWENTRPKAWATQYKKQLGK